MNEEKEVLIVGNGDDICSEKTIKNFENIVAADGGFNNIPEGVKTLCVIGDFDSIKKKDIPKKIKKIKFPKKKDFTDIELAISYSIKNGYKNIFITGISGSRKDHFFTSLMLLKKYERYNIHLLTSKEEIFILKPLTIYEFLDMKDKRVSFFSLTLKSERIISKGLEYEYRNGNLRFDLPIGVSNRIMKDKVLFTFEKGRILCFLEI
ncbi:MAG: thiamine diphosphokinase [bacterium]|uniref:Thiamine diphosphokinase n=2 Tax=Bacteria candidate phyla TaxID=1783234 RepID=A0A124G0I4_UNCT6|nr:MAG: Thiamine pyrophosphokinase [candidate division TA06 bacterium 32_111]KUK87537.1 MAG: Thiamine pyrophosphokinase [candidate division TA06 bacterium 34_109]MDI6700309.1 thiamine diphosphokinase [bacterium]HAF08127.1 thiamine diphosphokinase [candidate division WOR-3 bacterium]HCP16689.1 thiamine diphosphokinase [candidate division WOR-3 bacterium]